MKIGFIYNHDALHQIAHTAPVAAALTFRPQVEVVILCSSAAQEAQVRVLLGGAASRVTFVQLGLGAIERMLDRGLRHIAPFRRVAILRNNITAFRALDVLVVPETTSLLLRDRFGLDALKFVWIPHGAGDRSVGFRAVVRGFDLVLLAGRKVRDRMLESGLVTTDNSRIVGYPKFDAVMTTPPPPSLFDNGRPTVLYNPHFDPRLSSWYAMGPAILDWFAKQSRYNLVFAPHVMLFQRHLHASVEHRLIRWRRGLAAVYTRCDHMLIDTGSARSNDMSYTRMADIYLGDASSQIYEWITRPRPAILLNPGRIDWRNDPDFAHWRLGDVIETLSALPKALDKASQHFEIYHAAQIDALDATFSRREEPAAFRAAAAIVEYFARASSGSGRTS